METIIQIKKRLAEASREQLPMLLQELAQDERQGVVRLRESLEKKLHKEAQELERVREIQEYEIQLARGRLFAGIDEAGRGPLAGPVVAAAVIMPADRVIPYVNDSKKLSPARREELYDRIMEEAVSVGVGIESPQVIDDINILQATYSAMRKAVAMLKPQPQLLLNDAVIIPGLALEQQGIVGGDGKCYSIGAASIIAKVTRDRMMVEYDRLYPGYGFAGHKGYGCASHVEAIHSMGACPIHRKSFLRNIK